MLAAASKTRIALASCFLSSSLLSFSCLSDCRGDAALLADLELDLGGSASTIRGRASLFAAFDTESACDGDMAGKVSFTTLLERAPRALWGSITSRSIWFSSSGLPSICSSLRVRLSRSARCPGDRALRAASWAGLAKLAFDEGEAGRGGRDFSGGDCGMRRESVLVDSAIDDWRERFDSTEVERNRASQLELLIPP